MTRDQLPTVGHLLEVQAVLLAEIQALRAEFQELKDRDNSPYFTTEEALQYLKCSRNTLKDRLRAAGVKPAKKVGGKHLYLKTEIEGI